jgi:MFS transporter, DHA2 family, multidrug resistance protein
MQNFAPVHFFRRKVRNYASYFEPNTKSYKWWLLANVMIGTFMAVLDATIVNVGLPKIMPSFGVGIDKIEWVITAYMLAMAVMLPTAGWLADKYGYKRVYFMGLLLFTFGSFLCGISSDENMLILSRIVQGLGAGAIQPIGMVIITREFPPQQRGIALGFWAISAAASVSFGPLIGGFLVDNFNWQLIFDVNVPIGLLGLVATVIIQKEYKNKNLRNFDFIGFISVSLFLPLTLYALTQGNASSNSEGWSSPIIIACFAVALVSLAIFITTELTIKEPLIDLRLLKNHNFGIAQIIIFIFSLGMFGSTFLLPLYLQNSLGYTAIQSGAVFLPVGIIQGIMSPISGLLSDKINPKLPVIIGVLLLSITFYLNSNLSYLTEHNFIMTILYLRGFAMGLMFTPLSTISLSELPREKMAQASGITNVMRQLAGSFGVAILATLLTTRASYHSQMYGQSMDSHKQIYQNVSANISWHLQHDAGSSHALATRQSQALIMTQINREAFIQGIDDDFLIAGLITVVGLIPIFRLHTRKKIQQIKPDSHE